MGLADQTAAITHALDGTTAATATATVGNAAATAAATIIKIVFEVYAAPAANIAAATSAAHTPVLDGTTAAAAITPGILRARQTRSG